MSKKEPFLSNIDHDAQFKGAQSAMEMARERKEKQKNRMASTLKPHRDLDYETISKARPVSSQPNDSYARQIAALEVEMEQKSAVMQRMSEEVQSGREELQKSQAEKEAIRRRLAEISATFKRDKEAMQKTIEELEDRVEKMQSAKSAGNATEASWEEKYKAAKEKTKDALKKVKAADERGAAFEEQLAEEQGELEAWKRGFRIHVAVLQSQVLALKKSQSTSRKSADDEIAKIRHDYEQRIAKLNAELQAAKGSMSGKETQIEGLLRSANAADATAQRHKSEADAAQQEVKKLKTELEEAESTKRREKNELHLQVAQLKAQLERTEKQLTAATIAAASSAPPAGSSSNSSEGFSIHQGSIRPKSKSTIRSESAEQEKEGDSKSLEAEKSKWKVKVRTLEKQVEALEKEKEMMFSSLQKEKERQAKLIDEAKAERTGRAKDKKTFEERLRKLEDENSDLQQLLKKEIVDMRNRLEEEARMQRQLENKKEELYKMVVASTPRSTSDDITVVIPGTVSHGNGNGDS